jgi:hypothetical protein
MHANLQRWRNGGHAQLTMIPSLRHVIGKQKRGRLLKPFQYKNPINFRIGTVCVIMHKQHVCIMRMMDDLKNKIVLEDD